MRRPAPPALRPALLTLLLPALLSACFQQPTPTSPAPAPASPPPTASEPAPAPREPLRSLGTVDLTFTGLGQAGETLRVTTPSLGSSALSDQGSIQLQPLSNGTFTTGRRGVDGVRYLYATFLVRNATQAGTAYGTPRRNLTLVAISTPTTVADTPYSRLQKFDGTDAAAGIASTITPTAALQFDRQTERPALIAGAEDLQVFAENEVASLTGAGVTRAFPFGFVVRHRTVTGNRDLPANPAPGTFDGTVTVALKLPLQTNPADDPFTFNMSFAVVDDSVTRVTESPEEQTLGNVQTRAAILGGAQLALLCGSAVTAPGSLFIGSATTAGAPGTARTAHIGGDLTLNTVPPAYSATGNVNLNVSAALGLARFYAAYPTVPGGTNATLAFTGSGTARSGNLNVAPTGAFTFTSRAGDGAPAVTDTLNYTVSDGRGCTSPTQGVPVNVSGRVWFARNTATTGDGRQDTPFPTLLAAQAASAAGDTLYLYRGDGTTTRQNQGLTLKPGQTLVGEGAALTVNGTAVLPAGQPASFEHTTGTGLTLATNNTVRGVNIRGAAGGVSGTNFGTFTAELGAVQASAGPALNLSVGTLNGSATRLDAQNTTGNGVNLSGLGGSFTVLGSGAPGSGGTLQATGPLGAGLNLQPDNLDFTLSLNRMTFQNNATGLLLATQGTDTGRVTLTVQDSAFSNNSVNSIQINPGGSGSGTYSVRNNTFTHTGTGGGLYYSGTSRTGTPTDQGTVTGNTFNLASGGNANAITIDQVGAGAARFAVTGNTVTGYGVYGISVGAKEGGSGRLDAVVTNNAVSSPPGPVTSPNLDGINVTVGTAPGQNSALCLRMTGNTSVSPDPGLAGIVLRQRTGTTFTIEGVLTGATNSQVQTAVQASNAPSAVRIRTGAELTPVTGTCTGPT
jgi:hypothetical protein